MSDQAKAPEQRQPTFEERIQLAQSAGKKNSYLQTIADISEKLSNVEAENAGLRVALQEQDKEIAALKEKLAGNGRRRR